MPKSRRKFLANASLVLAGATAGCRTQKQQTAELPPGAPPAFGTAPPVGPEVSPNTFTEAAKLLDLHPNYLHRLIRNMDLRRQLRK